MEKVLVLFFCISLFFSSCKETSSNNGEDEVLKAFNKIDIKEENLFTKEDRKNNYKNSISQNLDKKVSLKSKVTYNGYGAKTNKKTNKTQSESSINSNSPSKKVNYSYQSNSPQTYSTYSTN